MTVKLFLRSSFTIFHDNNMESTTLNWYWRYRKIEYIKKIFYSAASISQLKKMLYILWHENTGSFTPIKVYAIHLKVWENHPINKKSITQEVGRLWGLFPVWSNYMAEHGGGEKGWSVEKHMAQILVKPS